MPLPIAYYGQIVRLADLVVARPHVLGISFENCLIVGPAVLAPVEDTSILECSFDATAQNFYLAYTLPGPVPLGAIPLRSCSFLGCHFIRISIAGPESLRDELMRGIFG